MQAIDEQRREIEAMRRVARMVASKKRYGVKALALMTIGHGAFIRAMATNAEG